jgi:NAD(P)-dependent dehydrogenase (short-subunit alcohol dehydrogenase family)
MRELARRWLLARAYDDQVVLITGAASGMGRHMVHLLATWGATVLACDRDTAGLESLRAELPVHLRVELHPLDVTDRDAFRVLALDAVGRLGRIDTLINGAGVAMSSPLDQVEPADWRRILDVNLLGCVHGIEAVAPAMRARGRGTIINLASVYGLFPMPLHHAYVASKHALVGLSLSLRAELGRHGVRVVTVCPGYIDTPIWSSEVRGMDPARAKASIPWRAMPAREAALRILQAGRANEALCVFPLHARMLHRLQQLAPGLVARASGRLIDRALNPRST